MYIICTCTTYNAYTFTCTYICWHRKSKGKQKKSLIFGYTYIYIYDHGYDEDRVTIGETDRGSFLQSESVWPVGDRVFFVLCLSFKTNVSKNKVGCSRFFLSVCSPIPMSGVWFRRLRLNPPLARGHSKPIVEKYFVFVLVPNAAAEPSLGSRAFQFTHVFEGTHPRQW